MKIKVSLLIILLLGFFLPKTINVALHEKLKLDSNNYNYYVCTYQRLSVKKLGAIGDINFYKVNQKTNIDYKNVVAESIEVHNLFNKNFISKNSLNVVRLEHFDTFKLYYCYSNNLKKRLLVHDSIFNLQIAVYDTAFKVGYPAILDGF